jgi:hypothetical protein
VLRQESPGPSRPIGHVIDSKYKVDMDVWSSLSVLQVSNREAGVPRIP